MTEEVGQVEWIETEGGATPAPDRPAGAAVPRFKAIDRRQLLLRMVDVEQLVELDHPARAIWEFTGRLDWGRFEASVRAVEGRAGRAAWDPRLLASVWIYALSRGIGSAREAARRCAYDPGFQWLTGLTEINYHTLADFRVEHHEELDELFAQSLGILSAEGLISLERVMHDGTKIRAWAGSDSFRREERLRAHLQAAREQVAALGDPQAEPSARQRAAVQRARHERAARLDQALVELGKLQETKTKQAARQQVRVSETDPQARIMKQSDGGYAPNYNVQLSTDAKHGLIVGVGVSQSSADHPELVGAVERVERYAGRQPQQVVTDAGFCTRDNVVAMDKRGIELIGSRPSSSTPSMTRLKIDEAFHPRCFIYDPIQDLYRCPAGQSLPHRSQEQRDGVVHHRYRAPWALCAACRFKTRCCPQNRSEGRAISRVEEPAAVTAFCERMATAAAQAIYRLRGGVAEFPNAWIKTKFGLRQFHVRGLLKVVSETLWAVLTYNIQRWAQLRVRPSVQMA